MAEGQQPPSTALEDRIKVLEVKLNETAAKLNAKADAHADNFVAGLAKKVIDSKFTWAFVGGAVVGTVMMFYVCI